MNPINQIISEGKRLCEVGLGDVVTMTTVCKYKLKFTVDKSDFDLVSKFRWRALPARKRKDGTANMYILTTVKDKMIKLHRMLLSPPADMHVDHINRNTMDNTRNNLRVVTCGQNHLNKQDMKRDFPKHIYKIKEDNYRFTVMRDKKKIINKTFKTLDEAIAFKSEFLASIEKRGGE